MSAHDDSKTYDMALAALDARLVEEWLAKGNKPRVCPPMQFTAAAVHPTPYAQQRRGEFDKRKKKEAMSKAIASELGAPVVKPKEHGVRAVKPKVVDPARAAAAEAHRAMILALVREGLSTAQIAARMKIGEHGVRYAITKLHVEGVEMPDRKERLRQSTAARARQTYGETWDAVERMAKAGAKRSEIVAALGVRPSTVAKILQRAAKRAAE